MMIKSSAEEDIKLNIPVIRLEIQGMQHAIHAALTSELVKLDADVKRAVEVACAPENVNRILNEQVQQQIELALKDAVHHWFLHTEDGQGLIKREVADYLSTYYIKRSEPSKKSSPGSSIPRNK